MKRLVVIFLTLCLLFAAAEAFASTVYYVKVAPLSDLNVRKGPDFAEDVIGHLFRNEKVTVKGIAGGWAQIIYKNGLAYVRSSYLSKTKLSGVSGKQAFVTLHFGSRSSAVKVLQGNLNTIMGYTLTVDGVFGAATMSAVRDFQATHGLKKDGIVGAKTWAKIIELR